MWNECVSLSQVLSCLPGSWSSFQHEILSANNNWHLGLSLPVGEGRVLQPADFLLMLSGDTFVV